MGAAAVPLIIGGSALSAVSQIQAGQYAKGMSEIMARDAMARGSTQGSLALTRGGQVAAAGKNAAAGSGVDVQSGSVVDVAGGTRGMSALDAAMIRSNAMREAYGYRAQGALADQQGRAGAVGTLLTGAGRAGAAAYGSIAPSGDGIPPPSTSYAYANSFDEGNFPDLVRG